MSRSSPLLTRIVEAGAGTGKTESLARHILEVAKSLRTPEFTPRLVATTFTERATGELRERVVLLALGQSEEFPWLRDFVRDQEKLVISTIHGVLSTILHRHGDLIGLDPEFTILDQREDEKLFSQCVRKALSKNPDLSVCLESYQFQELSRIILKLNNHYKYTSPHFKHASEWQSIYDERITELRETLKSLAKLGLSEIPEKTRVKIDALQGLANQDKNSSEFRDRFLKTIIDISKPVIRENWANGTSLKSCIDKIYEFRDLLRDPSFDPRVNERHNEVGQQLASLTDEVGRLYDEEKKLQGALTFNDLEIGTLDLVSKNPEILDEVRGRFDYWFIDEYQDTSPLQKRLLFSFFKKPQNAYFVGDPQQSIYLFRGADELVFQETKKQIEEQRGLVERLETNFRSHPDLLVFLNKVFSAFPTPIGHLKPKPASSLVAPLNKGHRAKIILTSKDVSKELCLADECLRWQGEGHEFHEMAVLVRTNREGQEIAKVLNEKGIPAQMHASGGFYNRREIIDALGVLSFIEDPSDDQMFALIARSPWIGIDDLTLTQWASERGKKTFWELVLEKNIFEKFNSLKILIDAIKQSDLEAPSKVFNEAIERLGFLEFSLIGDLSGRREANLRKLLFKLKEEESKPQFSLSDFIARAWQEIEKSGEESEAANFIEPKRVNILTIHKSKGLKFNCVAIPYAGDPSRPKSDVLEVTPSGLWAVKILAEESEEKVSPLMLDVLKETRWKREFDEEMRVFYVGLTRAAEKLTLFSKQKYHQKSWLGRLNLDLSEGDHPEIAGSYQVQLINENPSLEKVIGHEMSETPELFIPAKKNTQTSHYSVTEVIQTLAENEVAFSAAQMTTLDLMKRQLEAQQRGQAVHFIFEHLKHDKNLNDETNLKKLCEIAQKRFSVRWELDEKKILQVLKWEKPPLTRLISGGFTEWPFQLKLDRNYIEGQIDLWADHGEETWIIDYKSSKALQEDGIRRATKQLEIYALALEKFGRDWKNLKLAIVAPLEGRIFDVPLRDRKMIITDLEERLHSPLRQQT